MAPMMEKPDAAHIEQFPEAREVAQDTEVNKLDDVRTDKHGFVLIPQPSRFKDDPLVCLALV